MRRKDPPEIGQLAATFKAAMEVSERMKAQGVPKDEREAYVAQTLRLAWPKDREAPWRYYCEVCSDSGWAIRTCVSRSCGRPFKLPGQSGEDKTGQGTCRDDHAYAAPCDCHKGEEVRRMLRKERRPEDAVAVAARAKPTRLGR